MKKMPTRRRNNFLYSVICLFLLAGFAHPAGAAQEAVKQAIQPQPVAPVQEIAAANFHYNPKGKVDPFKPLVREVVPKAQAKTKPGGLTALERLSFDTIRLVGIGGTEKTRLAIISDSKGKSYILLLGSLIGPNNGRVAEIAADKIIIEEPVDSEKGKKRFRRVPLLLHKEESEAKQ